MHLTQKREAVMFYLGRMVIWQSLLEFNKVHLINYCIEETYTEKLS